MLAGFTCSATVIHITVRSEGKKIRTISVSSTLFNVNVTLVKITNRSANHVGERQRERKKKRRKRRRRKGKKEIGNVIVDFPYFPHVRLQNPCPRTRSLSLSLSSPSPLCSQPGSKSRTRYIESKVKRCTTNHRSRYRNIFVLHGTPTM